MLRPLPPRAHPDLKHTVWAASSASSGPGRGSRRAPDPFAADASEGAPDPTGAAPPTHWIGVANTAHFVPRLVFDGASHGGTGACGALVRGGRPVFRGEAHPRCGACIARLLDAVGGVPD